MPDFSPKNNRSTSQKYRQIPESHSLLPASHALGYLEPIPLPDGSTLSGLGLPPATPRAGSSRTARCRTTPPGPPAPTTSPSAASSITPTPPNTFLPYSSGSFNYDNLNDFITGGCAAGCNVTPLEVDAYDVLNRSRYGIPSNALRAYNSQSFNNYLYNYANGANVGGGAVGTAPGVRNMVFSGKILF
jgi:hypothetical protein